MSKDGGGSVIRWLHFSDLRCRAVETTERRAMLDAFLRKMKEIAASPFRPDYVFVTGNIAAAGTRAEYGEARLFLGHVADGLTLDPATRWFIVPGTTDADDSRISPADTLIAAGMSSEEIVESILKNGESMRLLGARHEAFYRLTRDFGGAARSWHPDQPWRSDLRDLASGQFGILQLNSVWASPLRGEYLIGEAQLRQAMEDTADAAFRIALVHHRPSSLRDFDAERVDALLGSPGGISVLLTGDKARAPGLVASPGGTMLQVGSGRIDDTSLTFNLVEADRSKGRARVRLYRYESDGRGHWVEDSDSHEDMPAGVWRFDLPEPMRIVRSRRRRETSVARLSSSRSESIARRYRQAAAAFHGQARFVGFAQTRERPNAQVTDLFVPLKLQKRTRLHLLSEELTTAALVRRLLGSERRLGKYASRIVILGDPGSGKTMLTRFLVSLAAGCSVRGEWEVTGEPLPLRLPFRDYVRVVRNERDLSLVGYLEHSAAVDLSVQLPRGFLDDQLKRGNALLLFDGLDEVGTPEERVLVRDRVAAFCSQYRATPVVVTSRIAGYEDAPLGDLPIVLDDGSSLAGAALTPLHYVIEPFGDSELQLFIEYWYEIQEPASVTARERGIEHLRSALEADLRVKELARRPLLATLIAMIHRFEAHLPGERAKLYELCVRTMLDTWPAARHQTFSGMDVGLQRANLEELAWQMQAERHRGSDALSMPRENVVRALTAILRERDYSSEPESVARQIAESWLDFLSVGTGMLVEQTVDAYAFFHLSFMEYLAARALERHLHEEETLAGAISSRCADPQWHEVLLLAVGANGENGRFLDDLYELLSSQKTLHATAFLLRCLREEARFRPNQREQILKDVCSWCVTDSEWAESEASPMVEQIMEFSARHGKAVAEWFDRAFITAQGAELIGATMLVPSRSDAAEILDIRIDASEVAAGLLDVWPTSVLGVWAHSRVTPEMELDWALESLFRSLGRLHAIAGLQPGNPVALSAALAVALTEDCIDRARIAGDPDSGVDMMTEAGTGVAVTSTMRLPVSARGEESIRLRLTRDPLLQYVRGHLRSWNRRMAGQLDRSLRDLPYLFGELALRASPDWMHELPLESLHIWPEITQAVATWLSMPADEYADNAILVGKWFDSAMPIDQLVQRENWSPRTPLLTARSYLLISAAGEIEATMRAGINEDSRSLILRLQNRAILGLWAVVDHVIPDRPSSEQLALYFALAWTQSVSTWAWPGTPRWIDLFSRGAGEHWLTRVQWNLCALTHDPSSADHLRGLVEALQAGIDDGQLPGFASRLGVKLGLL